MKTTNFKAINGKNTLQGVLILGKNKNEVIFDTNLEGFPDTTIDQRNIKDVKNFIASLIARFDTKEIFETVKVGRTEVPILRQKDLEPEIETVYVQGEGLNKKVFSKPHTEMVDHFGNIALVDLDVKEVTVPHNFEYTKDPVLNRILTTNVVPFDYNRKINKTILDVISKFSKGKINPDKTIFIDGHGMISSSLKYALVTINQSIL